MNTQNMDQIVTIGFLVMMKMTLAKMNVQKILHGTLQFVHAFLPLILLI